MAPLTACEDVPLAASGKGGAAAGPDQADPDEALLEDTVRAEREMLSLLRPLLGTVAAGRRRVVRETVAVHEAHLELLGDTGSVPGDGPRRRTPTWRVVGAEEKLARRHADAAVRAQSGPFARVLAGMAAASAQQAEVWRSTAGTTS